MIAGYYFVAGGAGHGFVRSADGTFISFDPPGSRVTTAVSINSRGAVTGYYHEANDLVVHGFVRRAGGTIVSFDAPGSTATYSVGINDVGAITGYYTAPNGRSYGFLRDPHGNFTSFDPGLYTFPTGINDEGTITGYYSDNSTPEAGITHGFVRSPQGLLRSTPTIRTRRCAAPLVPRSTLRASIRRESSRAFAITKISWSKDGYAIHKAAQFDDRLSH